MIRAFFLIALVPCVASFGYEGPTLVDNSDEIEIRDVIKRIVKSFDDEDVSAYETCFRQSKRKPMRRQAAILFAGEECHMELVDAHFIELTDSAACVAVKYRMGGSQSLFDILSELYVVKEDGQWVVDRELVRSSSAGTHARYASRSAPPQKPKPDGEWDPYNPDPARISPNLHDLIGDIGIQPGFGCVDGNCAGGRCQK